MCGGYLTPSSCVSFSPGQTNWSQEPYSLLEKRYFHSSWTLSNGSVLLLGGVQSPATTELVTEGVGSSPGFDLKYPSL